MHDVQRMLASSPNGATGQTAAISACIEACLECEQTCTSCADACLGEEQASKLRRCIRLNQDCADICGTTARVLSRLLESDPAVTHALLEACASACNKCGIECHHHASHHAHCKICAEACRRCEERCRTALAVFASAA